MTMTTLRPEDLGPTCDPAVFGAADTTGLRPLEDFVGQERAVEALRDGLALASAATHVFVVGPPRSGRDALVARLAAEAVRDRPAPPDLCYLHDVDDPLAPVPVLLGAGEGPAFVARVEALVAESLGGRRARLAEIEPHLRSEAARRALARLAERDAVQLPACPAVVLTTGSAAPVVTLEHPTLENLTGRVERRLGARGLETDVSCIRAGALHRANGGVLVVPGADICRRPDAWDALKRALSTGRADIEEPERAVGGVPVERLRPLPVAIDVKVVVIGTSALWYQLLGTDEDLGKLFKVKVELDDRMDRSQESIVALGRWVAALCRTDGLLHIDATGLARLVDHASEIAEDRAKLTTLFGLVGDVAREADQCARREGAAKVGSSHVTRALEARRRRVDLFEDHVQEWLTRGTLAVELSGEVVGQVNGLSVIDLGDHWFVPPGSPRRSGRGAKASSTSSARASSAVPCTPRAC